MRRTTESSFQVESPTIHGTAVGYRHYLTAAAVILLLAALALLAAAMSGHHAALAMSDHGSHSGDDAYDPATGAHPELSVPVPALVMSNRGGYSGDDAYDPASVAIANQVQEGLCVSRTWRRPKDDSWRLVQ